MLLYLCGLSFQVCLRVSPFIDAFDAETDVHLNGLDKPGEI